MGCPFRTPPGALEALRLCAYGYFNPDDDPEWVAPTTLLGPQGVGSGYGCCDNGLLELEWLSTASSGATAKVSGTNCYENVAGHYRIKVSRCVAVFDPESIKGNSPSVADRNAAALAISEEAWGLLEALLCCVSSEWEDCGFRFTNLDMHPPSGRCWSYTILIRSDLVACCS